MGVEMSSCYHVTSIKKLNKYIDAGVIKAPVRCWDNIASAERFSKQTGRPIILRMKLPPNLDRLEGHRGEAYIINEDVAIKSIFSGWER
mgnify:CR=1 FL=1